MSKTDSGSLASTIQSWIGSVPAGNIFSILQSAGAGGKGTIYAINGCKIVGATLSLTGTLMVVKLLLDGPETEEGSSGKEDADP
jgi:hypothetical protein